MITFNEAQILAWASPLIWPFLRALALFTALPVLGSRTVPARVRVALAAFIALASQASLPPMPVVALDSPLALMLVAQQLVIGLSLGFAVRLAFTAVEFAVAALVALGTFEIGQAVVVRPAFIAQRGPVVVVLTLATDVNQAIDGTAAAQRLAAWPIDLAAVHARVGLGLEAPVHLRVPHRLAVADGQVDPDRGVGGAGFQQQHARLRVFAQTAGQCATG